MVFPTNIWWTCELAEYGGEAFDKCKKIERPVKCNEEILVGY